MKLNNKLMKPVVSACNYDTNIFGTPHTNKLIRTGNVVEITFMAPVTNQPSGNTNIITNLPSFAKGNDAAISSVVGTTRFIPDATSTPKQLWTYDNNKIRTDKDLLTAGKWLYINLTYITID